MTPDEPRALLINGTVGAGKTTVARKVGALLTAAGVPHAVIDLDEIRLAWPAPPDDPFHSALMLANLAALVPNFLRAGAQRLVLAGVLETAADRLRHAAAVGVPLQVARLRVENELLRDRLLRRHSEEPDALAWHLDRFAELQGIQDRAAAEDVLVRVDEPVRPRDLAARLLAAVGWSDSAPA